jgi:hypothetical protein
MIFIVDTIKQQIKSKEVERHEQEVIERKKQKTTNQATKKRPQTA